MSTAISTVGDIPTEPIAFGKYFLVRKLAEGGMAEIFLAKQVGAEGFERNVVIKRMLSNLSSAPDFVNMFLDEARLAARLAHPNIVQIHDLGQAEGCYYICMEYLAGEDFSTVLRAASKRREYVPMGIVLRVIIEAAHGLHFAHEFADDSGRPLNIVHRDISPSNIYVTYQGQVKVLDFGIAKAESRVTQTTAGVVKGKYMYMAPEQAKGLAVDARADVFSLGVSLYEALTNTRPFARDVDLAILNAVLTGDFKPPRQLRPEIPPELEAVVLKAMASDPEVRYASAAEMAADLEYLLSATPVASPQVSQYLRGLFGDERLTQKTRIPTLVSLRQAAAAFQQAPGRPSRPMATPYQGNPAALPQSQPQPVRAEAESDAVADTKVRSRPVPWWRLALAGLGACVLVVAGGIAVVKLRQPRELPAPVPVTAPPPRLAQATPDVQAAPAPDKKPEPQPPAGDPPADAGTMSTASANPGPAEPPANPEKAAEPVAEPVKSTPVKSSHVVARPVVLDAQTVQKIVNRGRGPIIACFESFKQDLPGDKGQVSVTFSIIGSGKVMDAHVAPAFAGTKVGQCLEQRVTRLKFPAHKDKEVSLTVPFGYSVVR